MAKGNPIIEIGYRDKLGNYYENVREIAYKKDGTPYDFGKYITETRYEPNNYFNSSDNLTTGVYIFQNNFNPDVAYRIYKEFLQYNFDGYLDDRVVPKLVERQPKVKLSKFPTGIITLEGKIIGQEIPYFKDYSTLLETITNGYDNPFLLYKKVLLIVKEMYENGIIYIDIHAHNFMIKGDNVEVIDFEHEYVTFDDYSKYSIESLFTNFIRLVHTLNNARRINEEFDYHNYDNFKSFDILYDQLNEMEDRFVKKKTF